jgi:pyruvate dehydrogenase E2 component (dihydrolipoamide acetyltransferase)
VAAAGASDREEERRAARQRMIGALMARSKREIPHYYLEEAIDVTGTMRWLEAENAKRPLAERVLFAAVLLRSVAVAAAAFPALNGHFEDGDFRPSEAVHLGVAIALRDGSLVTPAILDAASKPLPALMASLRDLVERARAGKLRASEMSSATITVTNLGDTGVDTVHGVIYPPQVALVGFGRVSERPWAEQGMLAVRSVVTATLAADHRVSNGHAGGRFLNAVARNLMNPEKL